MKFLLELDFYNLDDIIQRQVPEDIYELIKNNEYVITIANNLKSKKVSEIF